MKFRGAIFDMGDIFFDATGWRRALAVHLAELGVDIDYPRLVPLWESALVPVYKGRTEYWATFQQFIGSLGLNGSQLDALVSASRDRAAQAEKRVLFDGVAETLADMHADGVKMAVLSDTESTESRVRVRLAALGLEPYLAAVVTSHDLGFVKPEPEAYQAALDRLGLEKDHAVFVGHDVDELQGAIDAGITAVAYNYQEGAPANYHLRHFSDLRTLMRDGRLPLR